MLAAASLVTTTTATTANPADHRTTTTVPFLTKNSHSILYFSRDLSLRISDKIAETEKEKEKTKAESPRKEKNKEKEKSKSKAGSPTSRKKSEHGRHSPTLAELVTTTKKVQQTHKRSIRTVPSLPPPLRLLPKIQIIIVIVIRTITTLRIITIITPIFPLAEEDIRCIRRISRRI